MDRRRFLLTSFAGALTAPIAVEAQQKVYRIGVLSIVPEPETMQAWRQGLLDHGYIEGQNRPSPIVAG
jgi:hypothetical protein